MTVSSSSQQKYNQLNSSHQDDQEITSIEKELVEAQMVSLMVNTSTPPSYVVSHTVPGARLVSQMVSNAISDTVMVSDTISNPVSDRCISPQEVLWPVEVENLVAEIETLWQCAESKRAGEPARDYFSFEDPKPLLNKLEDIVDQSLSASFNSLKETYQIEDWWLPDEDNADFRLGALLLELGLVNGQALEECLEAAVEFSLPLGRVLVMSGRISGAQLQWAIQLQSLLKETLITRRQARQVAELMTCPEMSLTRALNCINCADALESLSCRATRIGDLLVQSEIVGSDEFNEMLYRAQSLGLPVGRLLVISGLITESLLETVVNAQRFVREGKLSREDAVDALRRAARRQSDKAAQIDFRVNKSVPLKTMRLGELLSLAGVVTETQIEHALEIGLTTNVPLGRVLVDLEIISEYTLEMALALHGLVTKCSLEPIDAAYVMIDIHHHGLSLTEALERNRSFNHARKTLNFKHFLATIELISQDQIDEAIETACRSPFFVSKALVFSGALADATVQTALLCHFYARESMLSQEESMLLFNLCHKTGISVDEGLKELGLTLRMQH